MEWLNGSQSADRRSLLPGFRIEEAQLRATPPPRPRFPTSRSQALFVSEFRKCPSCPTPKKQSETKSTYVSSNVRRRRPEPRSAPPRSARSGNARAAGTGPQTESRLVPSRLFVSFFSILLPKACSSLQSQQSVKKGTIALQGNPQVFSGHVVAAVPLPFQARSLVGETFRESLHHRSDHCQHLRPPCPGVAFPIKLQTRLSERFVPRGTPSTRV